MKAKILGLLAVGLLGVSTANPALALTLSPAVPEIFFNWQITPFNSNDTIFAFLQSPDGQFGDAVHVRVFDGLNGSGAPIASGDADVPAFDQPFIGFGDLDGTFSIGLRSISGTFDVSPCVRVADSTTGPCLAPVSNTVPEPGSLALLGLGLAGLGLSRRRKA